MTSMLPDGQITETGATRNRLLRAQADGTLKVCRYEHGGGRIYIDGPTRELVCDLYQEDVRELIIMLLGLDSKSPEPLSTTEKRR